MGVILGLAGAIVVGATTFIVAVAGITKLQHYIEYELPQTQKAEAEENKIFRCRSCKRFQRQWQVKLHKVLHGEQVCVHCGEAYDPDSYIGLYGKPLLQEVDPDLHGHWLQRDPDCPEKRGKEFRVFLKDLDALKELKREQQEQEELEAYNKLREVSYWQKVAIAEKLNHHVSDK